MIEPYQVAEQRSSWGADRILVIMAMVMMTKSARALMR